MPDTVLNAGDASVAKNSLCPYGAHTMVCKLWKLLNFLSEKKINFKKKLESFEDANHLYQHCLIWKPLATWGPRRLLELFSRIWLAFCKGYYDFNVDTRTILIYSNCLGPSYPETCGLSYPERCASLNDKSMVTLQYEAMEVTQEDPVWWWWWSKAYCAQEINIFIT